MSKIILIVAAHTDDEALGCGGTIARHVDHGDIVHAIFITDGISSRAKKNKEEFNRRINAANSAHKILGISEVHHLNLPDNQLDTLPFLSLVKKIEKLIYKLSPQVIFTHHHGDLNIDHRITHQAVMTAVRPTPKNTVKEILAFEVLSSTEWQTPNKLPFLPDTYIDISKYLKTKIRAVQSYDLEMHPIPHSRSIKHVEYLAYHRGLSVGTVAAEAFMTIRRII